MKYIFFFVLTWVIQPLVAQNSTGSNIGSQGNAFSLFQDDKYESVLLLLDRKMNKELSEEYLVEISKLKLGGQKVKKLETLVSQNPGNALNSIAGYSLAQFHFHKGKIETSAKHLKKIDGSELSINERADYYFMKGYVAVHSDDYRSASAYFDRSAKLIPGEAKTSYYQGFTYYHLNKKDKALGYLEMVRNDRQYEVSANFFIAKILLENEKYDQVIQMAQSALTEEVSETNSAYYQVIGEAWALKNSADKAANFFGRAIELHPDKPSAALYYQAGAANFKLGLKQKAIEFFKKAGIRSGDYAQLSAFQLGRLYVSSNEIEKASNAYIEASSSNDLTIKEESTYMSGKLLVDQKNYPEGIRYLQDYLSLFPAGKWVEEVQQILAEAYLRTSNYDQAISHLKEIGITSRSQQVVYQKVTFQKGQLLFNDVQFAESVKWLSESTKYPVDAELENDAYFLIAESYFNQSDFNQSVDNYYKQKNPDAGTFYGLGYSNYNLQKYKEASEHFERFIKMRPGPKLKTDAEVRLADCYYAMKDYRSALNLYDQVNKSSRSDYLLFQIGVVKKNIGDVSGAISSFDQVIKSPSSTYKDDAIFQTAQLSFEKAEFEKSEFRYSELISKYPTSPFLVESYLNRAVSRTNLGRMNGAKADFQYILKNHIQSDIAFNAILGLQELESKGVKVKDIEESIEKYRQANPNDKSLEVIEFEFAKSQYFNLDYSSATTTLRKFISGYSESSYLNQAKYYLADSYYRLDSLNEAAIHFNSIRNVRDQLTGRILSRLGDLYYSLSNYDQALIAYQELISLDLTPKDLYNGRLGLMNTYYAKNEFEKSIELSGEIIYAEWKPLNGERNAMLVKANSYLALGNKTKAVESFENISDNTDAISAEALYNLALIEFKNANYQESIDKLFDFNSKFGSYVDWIDKSYLLIADNYIQKDDLFQAKATLRSIIQHTSGDETRKIAQERLDAIENQLAQDTVSNDEN